MVHFTTFLALVVGSMEAIQPAAAGVLAGPTARIDLGLVNANAFQRRQTSTPEVPPECEAVCDPINGIVGSDTCPPAQCCLASFEASYFSCAECVGSSLNTTDYSIPQASIDTLYNNCASLGIQLPILIFPGQSSVQPLSSVVQTSTSQSTVSAFVPTTTSIVQSTISATPATTPTNTATTSTPSLSSGIRSIKTSCFDPITSAMMVGTWLYFAM